MAVRKLLKFISLLLQYPEKEIQALDWNEILAEINDLELTPEVLQTFENYYRQSPLETLQENYVRTFDFNDRANLYLTYSKMGDEKERGQALAELKWIYERSGFVLNSAELPDYLPLFLEFVSHADSKIGIELLKRFREPIEKIQQTLAEDDNPYASLLQSLLLVIEHTVSKGVL